MRDTGLRPQEFCVHHPEVKAIQTCALCFDDLCSSCCTLIGPDTFCPNCLKVRGKKKWMMAATIAFVICTIGAVLYWQMQPKPLTMENIWGSFDYEEQRNLQLMHERLKVDLCNRKDIVEFSEGLNRAGNYRGTIFITEKFFKECGDYPYLRWTRFAAHKGVSDTKGALKHVTMLIEGDPYDKDYWVWRAMVYENANKNELAINDFMQSMQINPRLKQIPINLARAQAKSGKPCRAYMTMRRYVSIYPDLRKNNKISKMLKDYRKKDNCINDSKGKTVIKFNPDDKEIPVDVVINGKPFEMVVDTGATTVVLSSEAATKLGLEAEDSTEVQVLTANGINTGYLIELDEVKVGGASGSDVRAIVSPGLEGTMGLLGMSFLERFDMTIQSAQGKMTLKPVNYKE